MSNKRNAKKEFLKITEDYKVIAAEISFGDKYNDDSISFKLKPLYTKQDWNDFMKFLNRDYNSGYGSQNLFATIYCEDGVWITRGEYDGAEWYVVNRYPDLREIFDESDVIKYERRTKIQNIKQQDQHD